MRQFRYGFVAALTVLSLVPAASAADGGNWSGYAEGLSSYVCQTSAYECSADPVAQGMLNYDLGKDAIGTGGNNTFGLWASTGAGKLADELDVTFTDAHVTDTAIGPVNWQWAVTYSWYGHKHGYLFAGSDDMADIDIHVGQSYDLGTVAGVGITASPFIHFLYWRGMGYFADYDDLGIDLPVTLNFSKHWYGTFEIARLWNMSRHYPSPLQMTSTFGYHLTDHWSVYVKYRGAKANNQIAGGSYIDLASYGAGISFTGL